MKSCLATAVLFLFLQHAQATVHTVNASGTSFNPNSLNVFVGDTIRWAHVSGSHTTTSTTIPAGAATWNSPLNVSNPTFEYHVTVAGVYNYKCIPHESFGMIGSFTATHDCSALVCDDFDACTVDSCSAQDGCIFSPVDCDDANACTIEDCDVQAGCSHTPVDCDDADACTDDSCVNGVCQNTPVVCDDADICTTDSCVSGTCVFTPIIGCNNPCNTLTCNDSDLCTTDTCTNGACAFPPIVCDDFDGCTTDSCGSGICIFTAIICDDGDSCTTDACNTKDGCVFTPVVNCNVGIKERSDVDVSIYPNPVKDALTVETTSESLAQIFITDISGKRVYDSGKIHALQHTIQTASFPAGIYLLRVESEAGIAVRKIQVE